MDLNLLQVGRTNEHVHTDEEIQAIRQSLRGAEDELQRTLNCHAIPWHRQHALREQIDRYKVAIAPHKKLPEHIWRSIFWWYIPLGAPVIPGPEVQPWLTLTRVCRAWRQIALGRSGMWRGITFLVRQNYMRGLLIAQEWSERAGSFPRYLRVHRYGFLPDNDIWADDVMRILVFPFQYRTLNLFLPFRHIQQMFDLIDSSLKDLELSVDVRYPSPDKGAEWPPMLFPSTQLPNLRRLSITGEWDTRHIVSVLSMSGNKLRHLNLDNAKISILSFLSLMRQCPPLEICYLHISAIDEQPYTPVSGYISMPWLRDLFIRFSPGMAADVIFSLLIAPELQALTIASTSTSVPLELHSSTLAEFFERSKPRTLRDLSMDASHLPYHIGEWLCHMPAIRFLRLRGQVFLDDHTAGEIAAGKFATCLHYLILYEQMSRAQVERILWMIEVRNRKARTSENEEAIGSITMHSSSMENELLDLIRTLSLTGIEVVVWSDE